MIEQAKDFCDESEALYALLAPLEAPDFSQPTLFKDWTFNHIIGHLHIWNQAAHMALTDPPALAAFLDRVNRAISSHGLRAFELDRLAGCAGLDLLHDWREFYRLMSERFMAADPRQRLKWAGPEMSVRSSISARLMETWAHGQAIYDALGIERHDTDRIKNIVVLGINTFGWSFRNRGLPLPDTMPRVRLRAPMGHFWEWQSEQQTECIEGAATEFCQVVTQVRNVADTDLKVCGEVATRWMATAQCFAGPPENPPAPGTRYRLKGAPLH